MTKKIHYEEPPFQSAVPSLSSPKTATTSNRKRTLCAILLASACVSIVLVQLGDAVGGAVWNLCATQRTSAQTFTPGPGRDFRLDVTDGTVSPKSNPELVLGAAPTSPLVLVARGSPDQLVWTGGDADDLMSLETDTHRVVFDATVTEQVSGPWRYREARVMETPTSLSTTTTTTAVRVRYVQNNYLQVEGEDLVLDVAFWKMEEGNPVNFVGGTSAEHPSFQSGGGRDWVFHPTDGTIAVKSNPDLVLGIGRPPMILVGKGSKDQLVFEQLLTTTTTTTTTTNAVTLTLKSHPGMAVGKKYAHAKQWEEWNYIESAIVPREEAVTVRYVDSNYLQLDGEDFVFDVSFWNMVAGNTVNFVGARKKGDSEDTTTSSGTKDQVVPEKNANLRQPSTELEDKGDGEPMPKNGGEDSQPSLVNEGSDSEEKTLTILEGIHNGMPTFGSTSDRDYVILGSHDSWEIPPVSLKIDHFGETRNVDKETYDYMSRGWTLADGDFTGTVYLENGFQEQVQIHVITVW